MGASSKLNSLSTLVPLSVPLALGGAGYAAWKVDWLRLLRNFATGPGRSSRILLLVFMVFNWKNLPFAWTYRIFYSIIYHNFIHKAPRLGPRALFKPMISETQAPFMEIDYNLHKSNSTYFADLDISRTHLVAYLCRGGLRDLAHNNKTSTVLDPKTGKPAKGSLGIMLGSVACSFKREIPIYKTYELWSRILSWDRKWMYIVTHYIPKGTTRPTEWLDPRFGKVKTRKSGQGSKEEWQKKIHATAISKYVFKVGRLTVHPAVVLHAAGLLPEREGGWMSGESQLGDESASLGSPDLTIEGEWDWRRVEAQRREGMKLASQFHALDELHDTFDGGENGALANFFPG